MEESLYVNQFYEPWHIVTWLLLTMALLFTAYLYPTRYYYVRKAFGNLQLISQLSREEKIFTNRFNLIFYVLASAIYAFYIYVTGSVVTEKPWPLIYFFIGTIALALIVRIKIYIDKLFLAMYCAYEPARVIQTLKFYYFFISVIPMIFILPFLFLFSYALKKYLLIGAWAYVGILLLLVLYSAYSILEKGEIKYIIIFLYFCTLEFLPLLCLIKWLIKLLSQS